MSSFSELIAKDFPTSNFSMWGSFNCNLLPIGIFNVCMKNETAFLNVHSKKFDSSYHHELAL